MTETQQWTSTAKFATFTGVQVLSSLLSKGEHLVVYPHWSEATHDLIRPSYKCLEIMAKKQQKKKKAMA